MDELEHALMAGFEAAAGRLLSMGRDPEEVARVVRRVGSRVVGGPLRSWALVLRAGDGRIGEALREEGRGVGEEEVVVSGWDVRAWCGPVAIDPPGVTLTEAARLFGVNRTTVSRWADPRPPDPRPPDPRKVGEGVDGGDCLAGDAQRPVGLSLATEPTRGASRRPLNGGAEKSARYAAEPAHRGHGRNHKRVTWKQDIERQIAEARVAAAGDRFGPPASYRVVGRRLILDYSLNRANRKRDVVRVWTPMAYGVDPGGEVWSAEWGMLRRRLIGRVPEGFEQGLVRVPRKLGGDTPGAKAPSARVWQWVCPVVDGGCDRRVYKLFMPMAVWTLGANWSEAEAARCRGELGLGTEKADEWDAGRFASPAKQGGFLCGRCSGLVYESSERRSSPGARRDGTRRRVDVWDRYVKRVSGGVLTGRKVPMPESGEADAGHGSR